MLLALIGGGFWLIFKLLVPRRRALERESERASTEPELRAALDEAAAAGIEVGAARRELDRLAERRSGGELYVVIFGEVSTGKSSLIGALLPGADVETSPVGGSSRTVRHYRWTCWALSATKRDTKTCWTGHRK